MLLLEAVALSCIPGAGLVVIVALHTPLGPCHACLAECCAAVRVAVSGLCSAVPRVHSLPAKLHAYAVF